MSFRVATLLCSLAFAAACSAPERRGPEVEFGYAPEVTATPTWKQRLDQPYVYVEVRGDYANVPTAVDSALQLAASQGIAVSGPGFALYYDDPKRVPAESLRARACVPVSKVVTPRAPLGFDVLESTIVVYAYLEGPYGNPTRARNALQPALREMSWTESGPLREIQLVDETRRNERAPLAEVQIPASRG
jgi:hypothetical protein